MYLKEIQMQGFKSFADKTKVVFDQGVTAVVGPNGSGKSNITESLRWALGESSAKSLRGGKMPDVIFAGTENRKPLNFASVTVVLDNSDQFIKDRPAEIRVERQIYRNGDSEYLIDGKKVRLRDVHDLFMDTGLGRDSFSIISQGRVEAIFSAKPDERRAIFEEAAGVLKYKTRKKETEGKLAQTQDNLDRLEDIIYELDNQIAPLTKQAETAKRFLELDQERKELYLAVLVAQIEQGKTALDSQQTALEEVKADLAAYYSQRDQMERDNQELKEQRQSLHLEGDKLQAELVSLTQLIADLEGKIALHDLEASQQATSKAEAQSRIASLLERKALLTEQLADKEAEIARLTESLADKEAALEQLATELANFSEDPDQIIEGLREKYVQLMQEEAATSNQVTALESQLTALAQASEHQASELEQLKTNVAELEKEATASQERLSQAESHLQDLVVRYKSEAVNAQDLDDQYRSQQDGMFRLMDDLKTKQARVASLEQILKNHTQFYAGVRGVLQESERLGGIVGAVSEHLSFETKYQTALEIALGGASQHVIVADEDAAKRAIAHLKQSRQGRATFLPLTTIKPRQLADHHLTSLRQQEGFLGLAVDLVRFDKAHEGIFHNLLGLTAIFENLDQANQAARQTRFQVRMVTLDGSEIRTGGAYAGGANRNNNSSFIKPELEELTAQVKSLEAKLAQAEALVADHQADLTQSQTLLADLKSQGEEARLAEQKARLDHDNVSARLVQLQELLETQVEATSEQASQELIERLSKLREHLSAFASQKQAVTEQIEQVKGDKDAVDKHLAHLQETLSQAKLDQGNLQGELRFAQTEQTRLTADLADLNKEILGLETLISDKDNQLSSDDKGRLEAQLAEGQARKASLTQQQIRLKFELEDLEGQSDDLAERMALARNKNEELIRKQTKLEADIEHLSDQLRQLSLNLTEHFQLSFEAAREQAEVLEDLAVAERDLKQIEGQIRRLGPVNLDAIAQFDEVSQRLDFLSTQRDDLLSAKDLLLGTIKEMDDEVETRFQATFEAIRTSFQETFRQMFGGGSANLILTENNWLTAGVEISVQPPGKKIQSLNLMSGGEKALSALALLFAIIRVKTIPFVILDEVEAALDEANVKRFGDYLNRFDKSSQFIVVTHRKGTMAAADAMYGVTMQESGVSKIVSVKLKDIEREEQA